MGVLLRLVLLTETLILRKEPEHVAWRSGFQAGSPVRVLSVGISLRSLVAPLAYKRAADRQGRQGGPQCRAPPGWEWGTGTRKWRHEAR